MDEKRKRITPQELLALIRSLPPEKLQELVNSSEESFRRAEREARCEAVFDKLDMMLSSHVSSRKETQNLLARLRAGATNQPPEAL